MMKRDKHQVELHKLIYTVNWEDPESDHKALKIRPGDTVMTITSGACNTLGFLAFDPQVIHAIDINPSQAYLLELKIAAMQLLEYPEFIQFLGLASSSDRLRAYGRLRDFLSPEAARFWDEHRTIIRDGFLFRGRYEYFVNIVGKLISLIMGKSRIEGLFEERDLEQQRVYYDRYMDIYRARLVFYLFYNKHVLARMGLKADYFRFDDGSHSFAESFYNKFRKVAYDIPIQGNYFLHVYLRGKYRSLTEVPDYLREDHFEVIRGRLDRIRIHTADAKVWLASMPANTFDCLSLSNICELMSLDDTRRMFQEILRTAKPGARLCFRNLILPREVPQELRPKIRKDECLSKEMIESDRSFVYSKVAAYQVIK